VVDSTALLISTPRPKAAPSANPPTGWFTDIFNNNIVALTFDVYVVCVHFP